MTEADYNAQIEGNRQAIIGYQMDIRKMEEELNEVMDLKNRIIHLQDVLHDTAGQAEGKVNNLPNVWGSVAALLNLNFFSKILDAIKGEEYTTADCGLNESRAVIENKIRELKNAIEQRQAAINSCNSKVNTLRTEKAAYLAAKATEEAAQADA